MKFFSILTFIVTAALVIPAITPLASRIPCFQAGIAEAGPLSRRLETKKSPLPNSQSAMQGGNSEAMEQCIEMLHSGDHEGAQECIAQLKNGNSKDTQAPAAQPPEEVKPSQPGAAGSQDELVDKREMCAEMLRNGNRAGARECIGKLRQ